MPAALAVTPRTDGNIKAVSTVWIDDPAAATTTYGAISGWDVSALSNMAGCSTIEQPTFNADISKWNVASVSNMRSACVGAVRLLPLSSFDTGRLCMYVSVCTYVRA
jgi:hypothetical protein